MTEMQILRKVLFEEIEKTRNGTADLVNTRVLIAASNAITQTYNTEIKARELLMQEMNEGFTFEGIEIGRTSKKIKSKKED